MKTSRFTLFIPLKRLVLLVAIASSVFIWKITLPSLLQNKIYDWIHESCQSCQADLGRVELHAIPFGVSLSEVHLIQGDPLYTEVNARVLKIRARLGFWDLLSLRLQIKNLEIDEPTVIVTEGDLRFPREKVSAPEGNRFPRTFSIGKTSLTHGTFTYVRVHKKQMATLHCQEIEAEMDSLGTTPDLLDRSTQGHIQGLLENSGKFKIDIESKLFTQELQARIDLQMENLDLSRVSPFFENADGVRVQGNLNDAQSIVDLNQNKLAGWVGLRFSGLKMDFQQTQDRGRILTFLSNLGKSIKLVKSNLGEKKGEQRRQVQIIREPGEALLHWILRGMKVGVLELMT